MGERESNSKGFTILELLLAMAIFTLAAVSLSEALNLISLGVSESIEDAELREKIRSVLLEETRRPLLGEETRETNADANGLYFRISIKSLEIENRDRVALENLFEVQIEALRTSRGGKTELLDSASTYVFSNMFQ